ncbi:hypothetical protein GCM10011490_15340 [Pseudoclavibacter endophyticus]|uniref:DUF3073 domain-containing protein n=1 Tax=Pseudoclavibacter endophyticus TaxID=1778590 RepID=A0A6H9WRY2_9MICO|nr:DUF3073 domain-containing protein [Pseudoclavibacter endophyticus]KAB1649080.1 DUF3073 domain-containing protein [Pseudoclavibacter endophyticus]GGA65615.1 hypothetical protein GCM10011490_15340 [Pseudoclavibacter endophyticus]
MGRGRQKAKHTKVARALKYSVPETNYGELERELAGAGARHDVAAEYDGTDPSEQSEDELSKWAEYYDPADDADGDEYDAYPRRA